MNPKFLPGLMVVIDIGAVIVYGVNRDARHTIYWLAAAVLTASVTF